MQDDAPVVLHGEVVDGVCFVNGLRGPDHKMCAVTCFKRGEAAVFVTDDGTGYVLVSDHGNERLLDEAKATAGDRITIAGHVRERGGVKGFSLAAVTPGLADAEPAAPSPDARGAIRARADTRGPAHERHR